MLGGSCLMLFLGICQVSAQRSIWSYLGRSHDQRDTSYINAYGHDITGRLYYTRTNTWVTLSAPGEKSFAYKLNNSKGLGLGISYRYLTLNASFKVLGTDQAK